LQAFYRCYVHPFSPIFPTAPFFPVFS
jgi:hypothetical protein